MGQPENERELTTEQLPDDPLAMPPPYWRGSGAVFHILDALEDLTQLLADLVPLHNQTEVELGEFYRRHPEEELDDKGMEEFGDICEPLWILEHKIKLKAGLAILMSAIEVEDSINHFCVYNLHKNIAESIEKLAPSEKLLIASAVIGKTNTKGQAVFEAIKKLSSWRNAFAHGHCVDRPTKSLRHNHLISPPQFPAVPDSLTKMKELVLGYVKITEYLSSISVNSYTAGRYTQTIEIESLIQEVSHFHITVLGTSNVIYDIRYEAQ